VVKAPTLAVLSDRICAVVSAATPPAAAISTGTCAVDIWLSATPSIDLACVMVRLAIWAVVSDLA
jgi:hypothetical protein